MKRVSILGTGAWGTALAMAFNRAGAEVTLWGNRPDYVQSIKESRENKDHLPGKKIETAIQLTESLEKACQADAIFIVTPGQSIREVSQRIKEYYKGQPLVICAKGLEEKSGMLLSNVVKEEIPDAVIAILSGPSFAIEVADNLPTAVTLACEKEKIAKSISEAIGSKTFRPYASTDIIGVQIGGAVKNVLAIASGMIEGKQIGRNAQAALITRSLMEMMRLSEALGGKKETIMGLSGVGDLILTANSTKSRNFSLGVELGTGKSLQEILETRKSSVTEGIFTAKAVMALGKKKNLEMPICEATYQILHEGISVEKAINTLLSRPFKAEI